MPQSSPVCSHCESPISAYDPTDDLRSVLFCECRCTRLRLYLLSSADTLAERLEQVWGPHAGILLLDQTRWVKAPPPCYRCNFDEMVSTVMAYNAGKVPTPGPHTCGLDSRHQPAGS